MLAELREAVSGFSRAELVGKADRSHVENIFTQVGTSSNEQELWSFSLGVLLLPTPVSSCPTGLQVTQPCGADQQHLHHGLALAEKEKWPRSNLSLE